MKTVEVTEVTGVLSGYAGKEMREPLLVAKQGKAVAVVIPLTEYDDLESVSLSMNAQFMEIIERSRASARSEGTRSLEAVRRRHGLKPKTSRSRKSR
jgi:PHD/YefM family antitoxin component YafN of YafNO toxin-antitoxin module